MVVNSTLPKFNIACENIPSQKESSLPTIHFSGAIFVKLRECEIFPPNPPKKSGLGLRNGLLICPDCFFLCWGWWCWFWCDRSEAQIRQGGKALSNKPYLAQYVECKGYMLLVHDIPVQVGILDTTPQN